MTNVAICYFGMTRSTKFVYESHVTNLFNVFTKNNIDYKIYMHTWKTEHNIIWEEKSNIKIDYDEYKLLNPDVYSIDSQNDFLNSITFSDYFNQKLYEKFGGDTPNEW